MVWPQKNSKNWGKTSCQNYSNWQCLDTRRAVRADPHKRQRCWNRSHKKIWLITETLCFRLRKKATKSGRMRIL
jgi:hypothetical protein